MTDDGWKPSVGTGLLWLLECEYILCHVQSVCDGLQLSEDHIIQHTAADYDNIVLFTLKSYKTSSSNNMV